MGVDFEERVDFGRLRAYRLERARAALNASDLGALLLFDVNNIRYVSSTMIGEWSRDKMTRYCLLTRTGAPVVWDFGSAAKHHRLHAPWLAPHDCKAGLLGLRGAISPDVGLFEGAAAEIASLLREAGVDKMPLGLDIVEPPLLPRGVQARPPTTTARATTRRSKCSPRRSSAPARSTARSCATRSRRRSSRR